MVLRKSCFENNMSYLSTQKSSLLLLKIFLPILLTVIVSSGLASNQNISFKKKYIKVGNRRIRVEIAETDDQHARGLMFRKKINKDEGMLFVFKESKLRSFWMKNTFLDLSIGFFDQEKNLIDIQEMLASSTLMEESPPSYESSGPAKYALEMAKGWFKDNKINLGTKLQF